MSSLSSVSALIEVGSYSGFGGVVQVDTLALPDGTVAVVWSQFWFSGTTGDGGFDQFLSIYNQSGTALVSDAYPTNSGYLDYGRAFSLSLTEEGLAIIYVDYEGSVSDLIVDYTDLDGTGVFEDILPVVPEHSYIDVASTEGQLFGSLLCYSLSNGILQGLIYSGSGLIGDPVELNDGFDVDGFETETLLNGGSAVLHWSTTVSSAGAVGLTLLNASGNRIGRLNWSTSTRDAGLDVLSDGTVAVALIDAAAPSQIILELISFDDLTSSTRILLDSGSVDKSEVLVEGLSDGRFIVGWVQSETGEAYTQIFDANGVAAGPVTRLFPDQHVGGELDIAELIDGRLAISAIIERTEEEFSSSTIAVLQYFDLSEDDTYIGGPERNEFFGGAGNDMLFGGEGADVLSGGTGGDTLDGGRGNDQYWVDSVTDTVQGEVGYTLGGGIDTVFTSVNFTAPANVELVRAQAGAGNLSLTGNDAPGTLVGNEGNNTLNGRGGNDQVNGNGGNDTLVGGEGRDTLVGGAGADTFVFSSISNSRAGVAARDVINGFDRGATQDIIDLQAIDANTLTPGVNNAFSFIGTAAFSATGSAGQLRLVGLGGPNAVVVEADINGDRVADFQIFINGQTTMLAGDFIL